MSDLDLADAAAYILGERPRLAEDEVWAVLKELGDPPARVAEPLARQLVSQTHPEISGRHVKAILAEWRAYAKIARERDWDDEETDFIDRFGD